MILVIKKVFDILEHMNNGGEVSLKDLTAFTGQDKGSTCNILKSLAELGYVEKTGPGRYRLSARLAELGAGITRAGILQTLCAKFARQLAEATRESGVVSTLRASKVCILAQAQHQRRVMISMSHYDELSLYHSVSGRILVSHIEPELLKELLVETGFPGPAWDGISDMTALQRAIAGIREQGIAVMQNPKDEISSFAAPVLDRDGRICAAIGLALPIFRLDDEVTENIITALKQTALNMSRELTAQDFQRKDFFHK